MDHCLGFRCSICSKEFNLDEIQYTCPDDQGNLEVVLDFHHLRQNFTADDILLSPEQSIWRYLPLLPVEDPGWSNTTLHAVGYTPVFSPVLLSQKLGVDQLWIKDESRNPTASFKDRASALVVVKANQLGKETIVTASTGNAGAALAGMSAAIGQKAIIFAPKTAPPAKVAQLLVFGAKVFLVDGSYDDAFDLTIQASQQFGWYCRNTGYNPFTIEGKKTAAYEIWEFFQHFPSPAIRKGNWQIFVSVGDGNIISGLHKGFKDLFELGWLTQMPRLFGVQAEGSAVISKTFFSGTEKIIPEPACTIADSISVDLPRDGIRAVRAIRETQGQAIVVSDQQIISAIAELGRTGIFAEPAGATSYAGVEQAIHQGVVDLQQPIIVINTGSGLKDIRAAMQSVTAAPVIEPTLIAVGKIIKDI
jgi:threonine synthase